MKGFISRQTRAENKTDRTGPSVESIRRTAESRSGNYEVHQAYQDGWARKTSQTPERTVDHLCTLSWSHGVGTQHSVPEGKATRNPSTATASIQATVPGERVPWFSEKMVPVMLPPPMQYKHKQHTVQCIPTVHRLEQGFPKRGAALSSQKAVDDRLGSVPEQ
ncbi:unnamed protein product [Fusarium venenatum]|uniref:Uncharacterized protein n=1 Tax=Fusarium venenatum TaxID=56646 RepID=A0A2L2T0D8_9HYPO|nr:uncharacterized protein FVRRES_05239 [Fusarium venenatum]CEI60803.1 unnamed protein product [Fusarium venenatum]